MERRPPGRSAKALRPKARRAVRLALVCVGRLKAGPERELFDRYFKRTSESARGVGISGVDLREIDESRARRPEDRREEEAAAILAAVPAGAFVVALDERGQSPTSEEWAAEIGRARDASRAGLRCRYRRPGRPLPVVARQGRSGRQFRRDDVAASACARDGGRAALPCDVDSCRPSLSPRLTAAILARFDGLGPRDADEAVARVSDSGSARPRSARRSAGPWTRAPILRRPFPPTEQQRAEKETELRGVEDTMRASDEQRRAIEAADRIDPRRPCEAVRGADRDDREGAGGGARRRCSRRPVDQPQRQGGSSCSLARQSPRPDRQRLAALQRMGTHPPPAILVKPQDMAEAIRAASILGSLIVDLKSETEALSKDIDDLGKTRAVDRPRARGPGANDAPRWRSRRRACPRSSRRARSRCPPPRRRSARSRSAPPTSPDRRLR